MMRIQTQLHSSEIYAGKALHLPVWSCSISCPPPEARTETLLHVGGCKWLTRTICLSLQPGGSHKSHNNRDIMTCKLNMYVIGCLFFEACVQSMSSAIHELINVENAQLSIPNDSECLSRIVRGCAPDFWWMHVIVKDCLWLSMIVRKRSSWLMMINWCLNDVPWS